MLSFDSLGIPDTSLRGLNTRTALSVRKSKSEPMVDRILQGKKTRHTKVCTIHISVGKVVPACQFRALNVKCEMTETKESKRCGLKRGHFLYFLSI